MTTAHGFYSAYGGCRTCGAAKEQSDPLRALLADAEKEAAQKGKRLAYLYEHDLRILGKELNANPEQAPRKYDDLNHGSAGAPPYGAHKLYMLSPRSRRFLRHHPTRPGALPRSEVGERMQLYAPNGVETYEAASIPAEAAHTAPTAGYLSPGVYMLTLCVGDGTYRVCDGFNGNANTYPASVGTGNTLPSTEQKENIHFLGGPESTSLSFFGNTKDTAASATVNYQKGQSIDTCPGQVCPDQDGSTCTSSVGWCCKEGKWVKGVCPRTARGISIAPIVPFPHASSDERQYPLGGSTYYRSGACQWLVSPSNAADGAFTIRNLWSGRYLAERNLGKDKDPDDPDCGWAYMNGHCPRSGDYHFPAYPGPTGAYSTPFFVECAPRPLGYIESWSRYKDKSCLWKPMRRGTFSPDADLPVEQQGMLQAAVVWANAGTGNILQTHSTVEDMYFVMTTRGPTSYDHLGASVVMEPLAPEQLASNSTSLDGVPLLRGEVEVMSLAGMRGAYGLLHGGSPAIVDGDAAERAVAAQRARAAADHAKGGRVELAMSWLAAPHYYQRPNSVPYIGVLPANASNPDPTFVDHTLVSAFWRKMGRMVSEIFSKAELEKAIGMYGQLYGSVVHFPTDYASLSFRRPSKGADLAKDAYITTPFGRPLPSVMHAYDYSPMNVVDGWNQIRDADNAVTEIGGQLIWTPTVSSFDDPGAVSPGYRPTRTFYYRVEGDTAVAPASTWVVGHEILDGTGETDDDERPVEASFLKMSMLLVESADKYTVLKERSLMLTTDYIIDKLPFGVPEFPAWSYFQTDRGFPGAWALSVDQGKVPATDYTFVVSSALIPPPPPPIPCWLPHPHETEHTMDLYWGSPVLVSEVRVKTNIAGDFYLGVEWVAEQTATDLVGYTERIEVPVSGSPLTQYTSLLPKGSTGQDLPNPITVWSGSVSDHSGVSGFVKLRITFKAPEGLGLANVAVYASDPASANLLLNVGNPLYTTTSHTEKAIEAIATGGHTSEDAYGVVDGTLEAAVIVHDEMRRLGGKGSKLFTCVDEGDDPDDPPVNPTPPPAPPPPATTTPAPAELHASPPVTQFGVDDLLMATTANAALGLLHLGGGGAARNEDRASGPAAQGIVRAVNTILFGFSFFAPLLFGVIFGQRGFPGPNSTGGPGSASGAGRSRPWAAPPEPPEGGPPLPLAGGASAEQEAQYDADLAAYEAAQARYETLLEEWENGGVVEKPEPGAPGDLPEGSLFELIQHGEIIAHTLFFMYLWTLNLFEVLNEDHARVRSYVENGLHATLQTNPYAQKNGGFMSTGMIPPMATNACRFERSYSQQLAGRGHQRREPWTQNPAAGGATIPPAQTTANVRQWLRRNMMMWQRVWTFFRAILLSAHTSRDAAWSIHQNGPPPFHVTNAATQTAIDAVIARVVANRRLDMGVEGEHRVPRSGPPGDRRQFMRQDDSLRIGTWEDDGEGGRRFVPANPTTLVNMVRGTGADAGTVQEAPMNLNQFLFDLHLNGVPVDPVYALAWGIADALALGQWADATMRTVAAGPTSVAQYDPKQLDIDHANARGIWSFMRAFERQSHDAATMDEGEPAEFIATHGGWMLPALLQNAMAGSIIELNKMLGANRPVPAATGGMYVRVPVHFNLPRGNPWPPVHEATAANVESSNLLVTFIMCLVYAIGGEAAVNVRREGDEPDTPIDPDDV